MTQAFDTPFLETERLILRAPKLVDFAHWAVFYASERARFEGGPYDAQMAWRIWAADVAAWVLNGYGPFGVETRKSGTYVGEVGIYVRPEFPEPELGWFVVPDAEGRGYAAEAAQAVMAWARARFGWDRLINIIDPQNVRSIALGKRLGGTVDPEAQGVDPGDVVIVHDLRKLSDA